MKRISVPLLLAWLVPASVLPQSEQLVTRTFTTLHGLPLKRVQAIHQDSSGNLWVGTAGGLRILYNGRFYGPDDFIMWGEKFNVSINAIVAGRSRRDLFVAGSHNGATAYLYRSLSPLREGLSEFAVLPDISDQGPVTIEFLSALETSRGEALFGSRNRGLWIRNSSIDRADNFSFRGQSVRRLLAGTTVTSLAETPSGEVWIGTTRGLFRLVDTTLTAASSLLAPLGKTPITTLHVDQRGTLWVGTLSGGVMRYDGRTKVLYNRTSGLPENHITSITSSANGDVWFGTASRGIARLRSGVVTHFNMRHSLPSDSILCLSVDRELVLWVGTPEGLTKILPITYHHYTASQGLPPEGFTCGLKSKRGMLWFGGYGTLVRFEGRKPTIWRASGILEGERFEFLLEDSTGALWIATAQGVVRFDHGMFTLHRDSAFFRFAIADMKLAPEGGVYLLTAQAIKLLRDGKFYSIANTEPGEYFRFMAVGREKRLWVLSPDAITLFTLDSVVTRMKLEGGRFTGSLALNSDGLIEVFEHERGFVSGRTSLTGVSTGTPSRGYPPNFITGFRARDGGRYLIDADGVLRQHQAPDPRVERVIRMAMGLDQQILERMDGNHLLMNEEGFILFHPDSGTVSLQPLYDELFLPELMKELGLPGTHRLELAASVGRRSLMLEDDHGSLWVGSAGGIQVLSSQVPEGWSPRVIITEIRVGEERFLSGRYSQPAGGLPTVNDPIRWWMPRRRSATGELQGFTTRDHLVLPSMSNDLEFRFHLPTHRKEMGVLYQYRLEGVDTAWSGLGIEETALFHNVPQGTYRFRVRAVGPEGRFSLEQEVRVSVLVPFWKTMWFWSLSLITMVYLAGRWYAVRMQTLREEHTRVTRQAIQESELKMARTLQLGMLPDHCPEIPGFVFAARSLPASDVGGDFYDFLPMGDDQIGIAVGDVSGHGITGAMIVGMARTSIRFASTGERAPARVLSIANERLRQDITRNIFIAMFYGILDPANRQLCYICAGQPTPILVRNGTARFIPHGQGDRFPLGILSGVRYSDERLTLLEDDTLFFYTDGIVEARNAANEEFGFDRLQEFLTLHATLQPDALIDSVLNELQRFSGTIEQHDDITIVVLQCRKEERP